MVKLLDRFLEEWEVVGIFYFATLTTHLGFSLTMMIETIYLYAIGIPLLEIGSESGRFDSQVSALIYLILVRER